MDEIILHTKKKMVAIILHKYKLYIHIFCIYQSMHDHVVESALRILLSSWMVLCTSAINACMSSSCWPHPLGKSAQVHTVIRGARIINTHTTSQYLYTHVCRGVSANKGVI